MSETKNGESKFVYVTYIGTTAEKLWDALTKPEFIKQYFFGVEQESSWQPGASWKMTKDGKLMDSGEVLECDKPRRLVLKWQNESKSEMKAEGYSRATYLIEPAGDVVKLTVTHEIPVADSKLIVGVSGGWPMILSSLKSFLETGKGIELMPKVATTA
ncbi:MAG: SRPBCC family protein [Acidobacteriaceae bacterium]